MKRGQKFEKKTVLVKIGFFWALFSKCEFELVELGYVGCKIEKKNVMRCSPKIQKFIVFSCFRGKTQKNI